MIDLTREQLLTLAQAAKLLPARRHGKRPAPGTLARWAKHGLAGNRLETLVVGSTLCTSAEALQRFLEQQTLLNGLANSGDRRLENDTDQGEQIDKELAKLMSRSR